LPADATRIRLKSRLLTWPGVFMQIKPTSDLLIIIASNKHALYRWYAYVWHMKNQQQRIYE